MKPDCSKEKRRVGGWSGNFRGGRGGERDAPCLLEVDDLGMRFC